jgi:tRNA threonylcarbamoyl adenosine modification protein YeaZ
MLILSLETALEGFGVALHRGEELLAHRFDPESRQASGKLLPMLQQVLAETGTERTALQKIVVNRGPGSFTGIRLGLATTQALSLGLGVPWESVTSFELAAYAALSGAGDRSMAQEPPEPPVWVVIDTKGFQMGCAAFSFAARALGEPFYGTPQAIAETCLSGKRGVIVGTGLKRLEAHLPHGEAFLFQELSTSSLAGFLGAYVQAPVRFKIPHLGRGTAPLYGLDPYAP